jgi:hypothetical protein
VTSWRLLLATLPLRIQLYSCNGGINGLGYFEKPVDLRALLDYSLRKKAIGFLIVVGNLLGALHALVPVQSNLLKGTGRDELPRVDESGNKAQRGYDTTDDAK